MRIKHLLLVEGLTLAGARRRLDEEGTPAAGDAPLDELIGQNARERIATVKRGLRGILDLLAGHQREFRLAAPPAPPRARSMPVSRVKASRGKASRNGSSRSSSSRRKRSA